MKRDAVYVRVLLVIVSLVAMLAFLSRSPHRSTDNDWLPSSFNPVGAGHLAFYRTLQDLHWPVERWREPFSRLSAYGSGNVLVVARSSVNARVTFSDQEIYLLDDWVKKGNTLILLGALTDWDDTRHLLKELDFTLPPKDTASSDFFQPFDLETERTLTLQPAAGSSQTGTMVLPPSSPLPIGSPPGTHLLWQLDGQPYALDFPRGGGRVVCVASDRLLGNKFLGQGDNLAIVLGLLAPMGHVPTHLFFEESHHGFSAMYALANLLDNPGLRFAGMLALLGTLAFFGSSFVRFGPIVPLQRESGRSTLEFVDSIAELYLRADLCNDTIKSLFVETHQRILQRLNLPPTAPHELIASRLQQAHPHLPKWKKLAQRFESRDYVGGLPPTGWLRVARELIEIKSAMA